MNAKDLNAEHLNIAYDELMTWGRASEYR